LEGLLFLLLSMLVVELAVLVVLVMMDVGA